MTNNAHRPADWKAAAPPPQPGPTFAGQAGLPKLPLPELPETLLNLRETLKPLARNVDEHSAVTKKIDEFVEGLGPTLHDRLVQRAKETPHWLEEWWDDLGYLGYRDSVVINVSYYYGFDNHPAHLPQTALHRAASLTRAGMQFRQQFKLGQVKPEATREGSICMDTWRWMFDCCRIPGQEGLDWSTSYAKPGDDGSSGHIVVFRKGRVWRLDPWQNGRLLSVAELEKLLQHINDSTKDEYPQVGAMPANNRDVWAKDYAALAQDPHNAKILETIQSAAFVVCLDDANPDNFIDHSHYLWHGGIHPETQKDYLLGLRNRWVDKPVQFIVFDNGKAGIMGEHSVMDGTPTVALCDTVLDMIASPSFDAGTPSSDSVTLPEPLDWKLDETLERRIASAVAEAAQLIKSQELGVVQTAYGKKAIKAFGVSPDSWAQMIVQLAYARLLKRTGKQIEGGTYEAAMTRKFYKGRTEAIRVVSSESNEWVASMEDKNADATTRKALFAAAVKKHVERARAAGAGRGVDRHLFGLKLVRKEGEPVPPLFDDALFKRSSNWVLSTSAIFSKHFGPYGWGEVVPDGFGVAYMTGFDDYLQYTITSRTHMPNEQFCKEIKKASEDLCELFTGPSVQKSHL